MELATNLKKLNVLLVPDSIYWVTGTLARQIAAECGWLNASIVSAPVLERLRRRDETITDRFDLVHFLCPYASREWLPRLSPRIPVVTSHHHVTDWDELKHNLEGDAIIAGSRAWLSDLQDRGAAPGRAHLVPYDIDSDVFRPVTAEQHRRTRERLKLGARGPLIGFFGKARSNDEDRKGTDIFLRALAKVRTVERDVSVLLVGPGWEELRRRIIRIGAQCAWIPFADIDELPQLFGALDFYWITARVEGGPITLLEAMSAGVCAISTPVGLALEVVNDGINGMLVPFDDLISLGERTLELWRDEGLRRDIATCARSTIVRRSDSLDISSSVRVAYMAAAANFTARTGLEAPWIPGANESATKTRTVGSSKKPATQFLEGFPAATRKRVATLETLVWSEHLALDRGHQLKAAKLMLRAWRNNPLSLQPPRVLMRTMLPQPIVKRVSGALKSVRHLLGREELQREMEQS